MRGEIISPVGNPEKAKPVVLDAGQGRDLRDGSYIIVGVSKGAIVSSGSCSSGGSCAQSSDGGGLARLTPKDLSASLGKK